MGRDFFPGIVIGWLEYVKAVSGGKRSVASTEEAVKYVINRSTGVAQMGFEDYLWLCNVSVGCGGVLASTTSCSFVHVTSKQYLSKNIERSLRIMLLDSALKFARHVKQDKILDKQLQESRQSTWTAQDITVDSKDRYTVRVLGRQEVHRLDNGVTLDEPRQLSLSLKLIADPKGRADRNLRSGTLCSQ